MSFNTSILLIYVCYVGIVFLLGRLIKKKTDEQYKGVIEWLIIISIVFPVIGILFSLIVYLFTQRTSEKNLVDYREYLNFDVTSYEAMREEAMESVEVLPITMSIQSDNDHVTKAFITKHLELLDQRHGMYLKKAIKSSQSELSHYASTTLNLLKDRHQKRISIIQQSIPNHSIEYYRELSRAYRAYWNSDLLEQQDETEILLSHQQLLFDMMQHFPNDEECYKDLASVYQRLNLKTEKMQDFYKKCIELFPNCTYFYESLIAELIEHDQWSGAEVYLKKLRNNNLLSQTSEPFQKVVKFLWVP
ncbi:PLDc_N domain-containing protein [Bacillus sp. HMF5848]|uniref:tetratricopeptide repeat protein n=1 Tax=Bacillus sp. HMF5848 TaxID=2495421 RepID=UPI000F7840CD|nr:PLD nuclease N-terminal domain-containing protein [Bacillus sp. HMF5848]RSK28324.1 PLDc_N domain-containing protein [Bacillus sp. HMF5848]